MKVSLITTERNEKDSIREFMESALSQSMPPDEIVIADGGSTDGTIEIIQEYIDKGAPIKLLVVPGNRSVGRNAATKAARNEIIACTDVGCRIDRDWLKNITEPFRKDPTAMTVAGFFLPESKTFFEDISATLMLDPNDNVDIKTWLPSSRSIAYKKEAWKKAGGYPEYTNFNEDTPYDLALKKAGFEFQDGLKAIVYWRPRPNLKEFYKQYYYYALGDALDEINIGHFSKLLIKYIVLIVSTFALAVLLPQVVWVPFAYLLIKTLMHIYPAWRKKPGLKSLLLMILLWFTHDLAQLMGYWTGYLKKSELKKSTKLVR
jgi:glycosyltransferase involved in cell wall biosynthesis